MGIENARRFPRFRSPCNWVVVTPMLAAAQNAATVVRNIKIPFDSGAWILIITIPILLILIYTPSLLM